MQDRVSPLLRSLLVAYSVRRVFVAKEATRDACVMSTVLSHALRHARGEELVLDHLTKNYAAHLQKRLAGVVASGRDQRSAEEALNARLKPELDQLLAVLEAGCGESRSPRGAQRRLRGREGSFVNAHRVHS